MKRDWDWKMNGKGTERRFDRNFYMLSRAAVVNLFLYLGEKRTGYG